MQFTMAQNPKNHLQNQLTVGSDMTPPLHQEIKNSFSKLPPRPPPSATASPSKKPIMCVTNSTSSSSSPAFDQLSKRVTRDLPNLSDCHACHVRINHTDPDDRLQTLGSVWRIVLLCKKCVERVNSGQTCPYCFNSTADSHCFKCCSCKRRLHKDCVCRYANSPPWSYYSREQGVESGFLSCIDCWVPEFFRKSIRIRRKRKKIVSKTPNCGSVKSLKKLAKDASFDARRKVVLALKANNDTLQKAVVAKNAMDFAKKALELVAKKDKDKDKGLVKSSSTISCDGTNVNEAVNDAELAIQLHRSMNSSLRISKTLCPMNSNYVGSPDSLESSGVSCKFLDLGQTPLNDQGQKLKVYSRNRFKEKVSQTSSEAPRCVKVYFRSRGKEKVGQPSSEVPHCVALQSHSTLKEKISQTSRETPPCVKVYSRTRLKEKVIQASSEAPPCITVNENGSCIDSGCSEANLRTYKRRRLNKKTCGERIGLSDLIEEEHNLAADCRDSSSLRFSQQEGSGSQPKLHLQDASTLCPLSSDGDNTGQGEHCAKNTLQAESCIVQVDRFLSKYSRRKNIPETGSHVHEDVCPLPIPNHNIPTSWSIESRTSSNVKHSTSSPDV